VLAAAEAEDVPLRLLGGVAVRLRCSGPEREFKDLDFATTRKGSGDTQDLLRRLGYEAHVGFNAMNARERLLFFDEPHGRQLDVFVGSFRMCHEIPLERRLGVDPQTVPLAELLLTKLQIVELNEKDLVDVVVLLHEHEIAEDDSGVNGARVATLCAADWGLWRTITANLDAVCSHLDRYDVDAERVADRVGRLQERIEREEKSRGWRLRAKIGDRKRWYELPEEVGRV
jgi:hypothetical protein